MSATGSSTHLESDRRNSDNTYGAAISTRELFVAQGRIFLALMLRDIKTRFGSGPKFFMAVLWPLSHSFIVVGINAFLGRAIPYGESGLLWFATGTVPFMAILYMGRFTMLGIVMDRALLVFPRVKPTDILLARAMIEFLNACVVMLLTVVIFIALGVDCMPIDLVQACSALGASLLLGLGIGVLSGVIAALYQPWIIGFALCQIVMWMASGVLFVPDQLPEKIKYYLSFNPALQAVEWLRSAYFEGYGSTILDKPYVLEWAIATLFIGLVLERAVRGKVLAP